MGFSIKWKLTLALIASGFGLVLCYVFVAKKTFEDDKISYVFETQGSGLESQGQALEQFFEKALLSARGVVAAFDPATGLAEAGRQIFREEPSLLAIRLHDRTRKEDLFLLEKEENLLPPVAPEKGKLQVDFLKKNLFLLSVEYPKAKKQSALLLQTVVTSQPLKTKPGLPFYMLFQNGRFLFDSEGREKMDPLFAGLPEDLARDSVEKTFLWGPQGGRFLISKKNILRGDFTIVAATSEKAALGALNVLFQRSLIFLAISFLALVVISLALARRLTGHIALLTEAATRIGHGNFDELPLPPSRDEIGVLSKTIFKMATEIKHLLVETQDKVRMEEELKTARLVQESLLPRIDSTRIDQIEIAGRVLTSTECGGDWWHYFTRGDDVYLMIADATGHGTPAALITAAARSVFSRLEDEDLSLLQMMTAWNKAVRSCSNGRVFMTGMLFQINTRNGLVRYVSAGHEPPLLLHPENSPSAFEFLELDRNQALGEERDDFLRQQSFVLKPGSFLVLFTDGLFAVTNPEGRTLSDARLAKKLLSETTAASSAATVLESVLGIFDRHRAGLALPDDVTLSVVHRVREGDV